MQVDSVRMLAPPSFRRKVDVPAFMVAAKLAEGWRVDEFPDRRAERHRATPGRHAGRAALVCGNGPSLAMLGPEGFAEFVAAVRPVVWAVNEAWKSLRGQPVAADYLVILDQHLWNASREPIDSMLAAQPGCVPVLCFDPHENIDYQFIPISLSRLPKQSPPYEVNTYFHGNSSGIAAVQMAMHCGCNPIYLIGHDLVCYNGASHGFGKRGQDAANKYPQGEGMRAGYSLLAQHAASLGVRIVNLSSISSIDDFERADPKEISCATQQAADGGRR